MMESTLRNRFQPLQRRNQIDIVPDEVSAVVLTTTMRKEPSKNDELPLTLEELLFTIFHPIFLLFTSFVGIYLTILLYRSSLIVLGLHWSVGLSIYCIIIAITCHIAFNNKYYLNQLIKLGVNCIPSSFFTTKASRENGESRKLTITEKECQQLFQLLDLDEDGFIELSQMRSLLTSAEKASIVEIPKDLMDRGVEILDEDKDGKLNYVDFRNIFLR